MKRIIKETLKNGYIQYRVEKKTTIFGITIRGWHTAYYYPYDDFSYSCPAIFRSLLEAQKFCGIDTNPVINKEEIY